MSGPLPPPPDPPPTQPLREGIRPRAPVAPAPVVERLPPELPPEERWWGGAGTAAATGLVCLLLGGLVGYLIGQNGESTQRAGSGVTQTVTNTSTVVQPKEVVRTDTVTAKTVTQAPVNPANEERRIEAESKVRKLERENEALRRRSEEGG